MLAAALLVVYSTTATPRRSTRSRTWLALCVIAFDADAGEGRIANAATPTRSALRRTETRRRIVTLSAGSRHGVYPFRDLPGATLIRESVQSAITPSRHVSFLPSIRPRAA